jgi:hypothetical protein
VQEGGAEFEAQLRALAEPTSGLREKYPDVAVTTELAVGLPDACIVRMARGMDLAVIGSTTGDPPPRSSSGP